MSHSGGGFRGDIGSMTMYDLTNWVKVGYTGMERQTANQMETNSNLGFICVCRV